MKETVYIPAGTEDYTGFTTHVLMETGTSEAMVFHLPVEEAPPRVGQEEKEEQVEDYVFPETREERFLDKDLIEFYRKKGYET